MKGIGASPGIAIGKAYVLTHQEIKVDQKNIEDKEIAKEQQKLEKAIEISKKQLQTIKEKAVSELGVSEAEIFKAHLLVLEDPEFIGQIQYSIENEKINAAYATQKIMEQFIKVFQSMDDAYFKERAADIKDVGTRLLKNILGIASQDLSMLEEDVVIFAHDLTPSDTAQMNKNRVLGFGTEIGGRTSHTAIMARSLEIPAVVGLKEVTQQAQQGDMVILDGLTGEVFLNPSQEVLQKYQSKKEMYENYRKELEKLKDLPAQTSDGHRVEIVGNIGTPKDVEGVLKNGGEGIGLYRTEFLYMDRESMPTEEEQFEAYKEVLENMEGKPVIIRTLDIGGDKKLPYLDTPEEMNPFLGWRAIRLCLENKEMFKTQLRAILRASVFGKALIMFPMISGVQEVRQAKELLEEAKKELEAENKKYDKDIKVGIMVEIPSAAVSADIIAKEVDFFSIGTNDLCQYTIAVDRMNEKISHLYQPLHPAILRLVKNVIDASHKERIFTGMCGEMAGDPISTLILLGLGLDEFSMSASSIPQIKKIIRSVSMEEAKQIAQEALSLSTSEEIKEMVEKKLDHLNITIM
ncbi:phosphoenolpyruvate--protein phosphotransferase [Garciella nitratireducens]|uniref:Phosphoenolpyruvate-protein phosphotransferase n=1 Tax=Garciella nitratireducens DSM 15102 TaxID=1121911 RepID=A0A1T4M641_9FIRM|nr:phosphoenolpyruvate--protein phosphotransferase [Garciella nitratireducens]SJZ62371.1 phosphoenolpyruvate--protein phosphotransferase [Garciella nitratireducens DSM 15102]